jgi:hypothetical protein
MMLILREVHYVLRDKECRTAFVVEHGVDMADLHVYLEWMERLPGIELLGNILDVCCMRYNEQGTTGTWHTENDCPWKRKAKGDESRR